MMRRHRTIRRYRTFHATRMTDRRTTMRHGRTRDGRLRAADAAPRPRGRPRLRGRRDHHGPGQGPPRARRRADPHDRARRPAAGHAVHHERARRQARRSGPRDPCRRPADRRQVIVSTTPQGLELMERFRELNAPAAARDARRPCPTPSSRPSSGRSRSCAMRRPGDAPPPVVTHPRHPSTAATDQGSPQ